MTHLHPLAARTRPPLAVAAALALLVIGAFAGLSHNGFVGLDDASYLTENRRVTDGLTPAGVAWAFTTTHAGNWHPLTWLSHMLDAELFGMRPGAHHLVSLAIHAANALLLFQLLRGLTGALWRSALAAALFAVHPLHVESVAWASERKDVLAALLTLFATLAWVRAVRRPVPGGRVPAVLFFAGALMAKPMPVTLPFLLLLLDWWPLGRWSPGPSAGGGALTRLRLLLPPPRLWLEKAPLFALAALNSVITLAVQRPATASPELLPFGARAANALHAYWSYLLKTVWPVRLSVYYTHSGGYPPPGELLAALLALGAVTALVVRARRRWPHAAVGWAWFLGTLVPAIGLVQVGSQGMADRYTYLPLAGVFLAAAWMAGVLAASRPAGRVAVVAAALLVTAGLALRTADQVALWRDDGSLFGHALDVDPNNWMAHSVLGSALAARGDTERAIDHFRRSLLFNPANEHVLGQLGRTLVEAGRAREGLEYLRRAVALDPTVARNQHNLGVALTATGHPEEAAEHHREALRLDPESVAARKGLALALAGMGRPAEAVLLYEEVLSRAPGDGGARVNLGNALASLGRAEEALEQYREAARIDPKDPGVRYNLGLALATRGDLDGAVAHLREAARLDPSSADAHNNLGRALASQGSLEEAAGHYRRAIAIDPAHALAHNNLGAALAAQGRYREAAVEFGRALEIDPGLREAQVNRERLETLAP